MGGAHLAQGRRERQAAVAGKGEHHARGRGQPRERAEVVGDHDNDDQRSPEDPRHRRLAHEPVERIPALLGALLDRRHGQHKGADHHIAE